MAGRGRGRGRGKGLSFNVESLGFGRGESLPGSIIEPPPKFPPLELKPVPLLTGEHYDYLLALKQEYNANIRESQFFIKPPEKRRDIQRYSDKYQISQQDGRMGEIIWSALPAELKIKKKRLKTKPKSVLSKPKARVNPTDAAEVVKHLEELEKQEVDVKEDEEEEEEESEKKKKEDGEEDEDPVDEEDLEEEELEDETDYGQAYFDNGESYALDEDDDLDEGAIY